MQNMVELVGTLSEVTQRGPLTCSISGRTEQLAAGVGSSAWQVVSSVSISISNTSPMGRCGDIDWRSEQCIALFLLIRPKDQPHWAWTHHLLRSEGSHSYRVQLHPALTCPWMKPQRDFLVLLLYWLGRCLRVFTRRKGCGLGQWWNHRHHSELCLQAKSESWHLFHF